MQDFCLHIISKPNAMAIGLKYYFSGLPCSRGHIYKRLVSNSSCVKCTDINSKAWHEKNPDAGARRHERVKANPARIERIRENARKRYAENPQNRRDSVAAHAKKFPEKRALAQRNRKARKKGAGGSYTEQDVASLISSQKGKCVNCQSELIHEGKNKYHMDHIIPLSKGGRNDKYNLQILCAPCNIKKSDKDPIEWAQKNGRLL